MLNFAPAICRRPLAIPKYGFRRHRGCHTEKRIDVGRSFPPQPKRFVSGSEYPWLQLLRSRIVECASAPPKTDDAILHSHLPEDRCSCKSGFAHFAQFASNAPIEDRYVVAEFNVLHPQASGGVTQDGSRCKEIAPPDNVGGKGSAANASVRCSATKKVVHQVKYKKTDKKKKEDKNLKKAKKKEDKIKDEKKKNDKKTHAKGSDKDKEGTKDDQKEKDKKEKKARKMMKKAAKKATKKSDATTLTGSTGLSTVESKKSRTGNASSVVEGKGKNKQTVVKSKMMVKDGKVVQKVRDSSSGKDKKPKFGAPSIAKWRLSATDDPNKLVVMAIIDGHGGWQIADYVSKNLPKYIEAELHNAAPLWRKIASGDCHFSPAEQSDITSSVTRAFERLDQDAKSAIDGAYKVGFSNVAKCGACCCMLMVHRDFLLVANAGDCKAVLADRDGKATPLNAQHNADRSEEQARLIAAHAGESDAVVCKRSKMEPRVPVTYVEKILNYFNLLGHESKGSSCYVKGRLQPTKSFGDFYLKSEDFLFDFDSGKPFIKSPLSYPYITATPDITFRRRNHDSDRFVILGSDGLWDFMSDDEAVGEVTKYLNTSSPNAVSAPQHVIQAVLAKAGVSAADSMFYAPRQRRSLFDDTTVGVVIF